MVDVIMWPKFSDSSIYMREVNIYIYIYISLNLNFTRIWPKKPTCFEGWFYFKFNNLGGQYLRPWNLHQCGKRVKIKSQKVLEANSNVCRSYMGKLVGEWKGSFFAPKIMNGLNELKWEDFFLTFIRRPLLQLTAEDCAI